MFCIIRTMTSEYTHYSQAYENRFIDGQTMPLSNPRKEINPLPNPIYKKPLQYFDSPVKNSSMYPNVWHIKPVNYDYTPSNVGGMIDKSIQENKNFVLGGYVLPQRQLNYKS